VKAVLTQLSMIADHCFEAGWVDASKQWKRFYIDPDMADHGTFAARYVSALFEVPETAMHASTLTGTPWCAMSHLIIYLKGMGKEAEIKVGKISIMDCLPYN